jgi:hypothetical protein
MISTGKHVCVTHREVNKPGHSAERGCKTFSFGPKWRPPKKTNDRAWKRIEKGIPEHLWDDKALAKVRTDMLEWDHTRQYFPKKFWQRNRSAAPKRHKPYTYTRKHWRKWIKQAGPVTKDD